MSFNLSCTAQDLNAAVTKANAAAPQSTTYTKTEVNTALASKADLVDGKVPASELPSYVDDTIEGYYYNSNFYEDSEHTTEITGESGKIYIDLAANKSYRWTGNVYVRVDECPAFGETQGTIYEGNKGKANADAIGDLSSLTTTVKTDLVSAINEILGEPSPEELITTEGMPPLVFESNGDPIQSYSFIGNMIMADSPSKSTPLVPQEFGDLVISGDHVGEYAISITIEGATQTIYLDAPLRKIGNYSDVINSDGTVIRRINKKILKGAENWSYTAGMQKLPVDDYSYLRELELIAVCSHYTAVANMAQASISNGQLTFLVSGSGANNLYIRDDSYPDSSTFKQYLADQYSANTPVCIWYVLSTETTEAFVAPTLTTIKGNNTLTVGTTIQPTNASVTCMVGGGGNMTPANRISYSNEVSELSSLTVQGAIDEVAKLQKEEINRLYSNGYQKQIGNLSAGDDLTLPPTDIKKNNTYSFLAKITSFNSILIGQGFEVYSGAWAEITDTKLIIHNYAQSDTTVEYTHGLTISDYIYVQIFVKVAKADVVIYSNGTAFKQTNVNWFGCHGQYFVKSIGSTLTDCSLTWSSPDFRKSIWVFGDSYVGLNNVARWATQLNNAGFATNVLFNGYAGESSGPAVTSLTNALENYGCPQKLIWCLGMNDGADDGATPSTNWTNGINQVKTLCETYGIELIMATIPSVPNQSNEAKNVAVRTSGKRYIDFAKAVGAAANGTWYTDMLSQDDVHPSEKGAIALYHQAIADCPELTYQNP